MRFDEASKNAQELSIPAREGIKGWSKYFRRGIAVAVGVLLIFWLIFFIPVWTTTPDTPSEKDGRFGSEILLGWNDYLVPARGSKPLVVPIGFRVGCFDPEIRKRVSINKLGMGTSKFHYELVSLTDKSEIVEILVANSKEEAQRITPSC